MHKIFLIIAFTLFSYKSYADKNMMIGSLGKAEEVDRTIKVIMYDNGKHAKRFLGNMFVEQSLVDDKVAQINYDKSILAIQSIAKNMNCNYYFLDEKVMDFKDDSSI